MQEIKKLNSKHRKIMTLILAGKQLREIIKEGHISQPQLDRVIRSPIFIDEMEKMKDEIRREAVRLLALKEVDPVSQLLKEGSYKAAKKQIGLLDSKDETIAQNSATDLLDRGGYPAKQAGAGSRSLTFVLEGKRAENIERALGDISHEQGADREPGKTIPK